MALRTSAEARACSEELQEQQRRLLRDDAATAAVTGNYLALLLSEWVKFAIKFELAHMEAEAITIPIVGTHTS